MTDISKEAVEAFIQNTVKEWVLSEGLPRNADDTKDAYRTVTLLRGMSAVIAAQDAKIAKLVEALRLISSHRRRCHEHDEDMGHDLREFDLEDLKLMEQAARQALASIGEADD